MQTDTVCSWNRTWRSTLVTLPKACSFSSALFSLPSLSCRHHWGQLLVGGALLWGIAEKLFLLRYSKRMPPAIGREALIGLPVTAVSACLPEGWVKLRGEQWKARCSEGAGVGDSLVVEAVEQITLIVAQPPSSPTR